jgi:hypothetical protein
MRLLWGLASCFAVLGCVGDNTVITDAGPDADLTGTLMHPCFPNNTCLNNLTCQLPADVCVQLDSGSDATMMDSSGSDAPSESGSDGGCTAYPPPPYGDVIGMCTSMGQNACIDQASATFSCTTGTCSGSFAPMICGTGQDCTKMAMGSYCCFVDTSGTISTTTCPIIATFPSTLTTSPTACSTSMCPLSGYYQLCQVDGDCTTTYPHCDFGKLEISGSGTLGAIGVCGP